VLGEKTSIFDLTTEQIDLVLRTNLYAAVFCRCSFALCDCPRTWLQHTHPPAPRAPPSSREACRRMAKSKGGAGGAIVNVSSGSAYIGIAGRELYTVSKGALNSLAIGLTASMTPDGAPLTSPAQRPLVAPPCAASTPALVLRWSDGRHGV
jgi:NAD(P)-dependent dehydrogenase (short-subunit alcohol dehydrogenase family)